MNTNRSLHGASIKIPGGLIGGFTFKKARKINDRVFETFGLEIMNVKHPQKSQELNHHR